MWRSRQFQAPEATPLKDVKDDVTRENLWECATRSSEVERSTRCWGVNTGTPYSDASPYCEGQRWEQLSNSKASCVSLTRSDSLEPVDSLEQDSGHVCMRVTPPSGKPLNWRRRKYIATAQSCGDAYSGEGSDVASSTDSKEALICGPLQRRFLGFVWRWRWCVLDAHNIHIYFDEAHWKQHPDEPLESYEVGTIVAINENNFEGGPPHMFRCVHHSNGHTIVALRGGDGDLWEEIASTYLWVDLINTAARIACSHGLPLAPATKKVSGVLWHETIMGA